MTGVPEDAIQLIPVASTELADVRAVFEGLGSYSLRVDGATRRAGAAEAFATAVPPGRENRHKHAFVACRNGLPFGLLDVVEGYPTAGTAFIGLLAVKESVHGQGLGRQLYARAERFARERLGARILRLAVVDANPVIGFWLKMGFEPTGEAKPYESGTVRSRSILMEKLLPPVGG